MFDAIIADFDSKNLNDLNSIISRKGSGFTVKAKLSDGIKVLEYITSNKVDIILTEIDMPGLNGVDLLKEIKNKKLNICVIGLSEQENFNYARQGIIYGAFDYIKKPLLKRELLESLRRAAEYLSNKKALEKKYICNDIDIWTGDEYYLNHPNNLIRNVCEYIILNFNLDITLKTISKQFYISPNYFSYLFKEQTGENFHDYLLKVKIEKAKILLTETNYKAYEVSHIIGYSEPAYFSKLFRKYTGNNPTEYRKTMKN